MKISEKKNIALVLSGGGIKAAAFHIGVCLALREKGFRFLGGSHEDVAKKMGNGKNVIKLYVGSSAGAAISTFLAAGYSIESVIDAFQVGVDVSKKILTGPNLEENSERLRPLSYFDIFHLNSSNFVSFFPKLWKEKKNYSLRNIYEGGVEALLKNGFKINGLFTTKGLERYMRKHVLADNRFSSLGAQLFIIGTQLNHSRKVIFGDFPETYKIKTLKYANFATISDAVAASASLPPAFAPYGIRNQKGKKLYFFDGEIRDTLSTHVAADHGADLVISSYSIQPYHFNKEIGSLHNFGIPAIANQALYQVIEQKIERHIKHQKDIRSIYKTIDGYFRQTDLPEEHREKLLEIVRKKTGYKPEVDYIYIHPSPLDHEMFFYDHFSLNPAILDRIVRIGFKSALATLRTYDL